MFSRLQENFLRLKRADMSGTGQYADRLRSGNPYLRGVCSRPDANANIYTILLNKQHLFVLPFIFLYVCTIV